MAASTIYIPSEVLAEWSESDYPVIAIASFLEIPDGIMTEIYKELECVPEANCSIIAYIADDEWEQLAKNMQVDDRPIGIGMRSRVRQLLLASRVAVQAIEGPTRSSGTDASTIAAATSAAVAAAVSKEDVDMVKLSDVALQGTDEKVKIIDLEKFRE